MSSWPTSPEPADRARQREEDAQYYREVLHKFVDMATGLAEAIHRQATAEPTLTPDSESAGQPTPAPDLSQAAIAFDRLARIVRRTIALARKLAEPGCEAPAREERPRECYAGSYNDRSREPCERAREQIDDAIEHEALDAESPERPEASDSDPSDDEDFGKQEFLALIKSVGRNALLANVFEEELRKRRAQAEADDHRARTAEPLQAESTGQPKAAQPVTRPRALPTPGAPRLAPPSLTWPGTGPPKP